MGEVRRLFQAAGARIERVDPASDAARWCVSEYFAELVERFEAGFDPQQSLPVDEGDFKPPLGAFLVASIDGESVACGAVKSIGPGIGYLKRMWVARSVRGLGFGLRMLTALESEAGTPAGSGSPAPPAQETATAGSPLEARPRSGSDG